MGISSPPTEVTTPRLIEKATNSTAQEVDPRILKSIKSAARFSDKEILAAVDALMDQMKKPHSQVRYLTVSIIDELFMRSKLFRSHFVLNLDLFLSLSVGFRKNLPLPPPSAIAANLRSKSIELLEKWNASFGPNYRQLRFGFDHLKDTLRYQFPNRLENAARLQQERTERQARTMQMLLDKFKHLRENFLSIKFDIHSTIDEIRECFDIAGGREGDAPGFFDDGDGAEELSSLALRQIRLESLKEGVRVRESSENKAVFDVLRESYKLLISKHLPSVREWLSVLVRVDAADSRFRDVALKEFIDTRNLIQSLEKKCLESGFALNPSFEEDEDLWEEGKVEPYTPEEPPDDFLGKSASKMSNDEASSMAGKNLASAVTYREKLLAEAPVLTWTPFLLDGWSSQRDVMANQRGLEVDGHWGRVDPDALIPAEKIAELNLPCTVYKEQAAETQPCLAPLKKGGLCQRKDLRACPFHGPIMPRDSDGNPIARVFRENPNEPSTEAEEQADLQSPLCSGKVVQILVKRAAKNLRERDRDAKASKRAKLAEVRRHNEEVLRDAAIASTSYSEALLNQSAVDDGAGGVKAKKPSLASMLKKKETSKDRIGRKLLSSRAADASSRQLTIGEDSKYREAFPNQW